MLVELKKYTSRYKILGLLLALTFIGGINGHAQSWTTADQVPLSRHSSTGTLLQDGRVLKAGGYMVGGTCFNASTNQCEIYDPAKDMWSTVSPMGASRMFHSATLLNSGEVLVVGGFCGGTSTEKYNPLTDTWVPLAPMNVARVKHTATLLNDGRVLIIGSIGNAFGNNFGNSCEIYDPVANTWTPQAPMNEARSWHTATLLPSGEVFVTGGVEFGGSAPRTEMYNPGTNTWTILAADPFARVAHCATLLPSGLVLVSGGGIPGSLATQNNCRLYNPATNV